MKKETLINYGNFLDMNDIMNILHVDYIYKDLPGSSITAIDYIHDRGLTMLNSVSTCE